MGNLAALPRHWRQHRLKGGRRRLALLLALAALTGALLAGCVGLPVAAPPALDAGAVAGGEVVDAAQAAAEAVPLAVALPAPAIPELAAAQAAPVESITDIDPAMVVAAYEQVIKNIYEGALPSVVFIRVARSMGELRRMPGQDLPDLPNNRRLPEGFFSATAGSGFVWDEAGHIVTNHHVVEGAERVTVVWSDDREMDAEVLGSDPDSDLALLKVDAPPEMLRPVTLGDSDMVTVGQVAAALGNPFGHEFSITSGIISGVGRTIRSGNSPFSIPEVLQTDASLNPGNSGGPLLDRKGQVIGVNTQIISRTGASSGIGFAVPINIAKQVIPALREDGRFDYAWLGISGGSLSPAVAELMDLPRDTRGALVMDVMPDSPAARAGLRGSNRPETLEGRPVSVGGDVIVSIEGSPVTGIDDVIAYLVTRARPEQKITLEVLREGVREELEVTLGVRPGEL